MSAYETGRVVAQNSFSRSMINDAKAGAYYTDVEHVKSCSTFFYFPEGEDSEVCCFDNSAGDGLALKTVTERCRNRKMFVCDINPTTVMQLAKDGSFESVVCADYLANFETRQAFFTFFWCNPPYGEDVERKERYEKMFLEKLATHLAVGAVGCFVIPMYVLADEKFARSVLSRYEVIHMYRFRTGTYEQFKQTVLFLRKKEGTGYSKELLEKYLADAAEMEELPVVWDKEKIEVQCSYAKNLTVFKCRKFNPELFLQDVAHDHSLDAKIGKVLAARQYNDDIRYRPAMPLGESHLAMQATCGKGAGAVGDETKGNYHLQRGSVRRKKDITIRTTEKGKNEMVETDHASITIKVAEQLEDKNGRPYCKITDLV